MASVLNSQNETESRNSDFPKFKNNEKQLKNWFSPKAIRSLYTVLRNFEKLRKAIINEVKYTVKWDFTNKMGSVFFIFLN